MVKPSCSGEAILKKLEKTTSYEKQVKIVEDAIKRCGKVGKKSRKKRNISGYQCYISKCEATGKSLSKCLREKGWAKLSAAAKQKYNQMAKTGC